MAHVRYCCPILLSHNLSRTFCGYAFVSLDKILVDNRLVVLSNLVSPQGHIAVIRIAHQPRYVVQGIRAHESTSFRFFS